MNIDLYELHYKEDRRFSFGKNWASFLRRLTSTRIELAKQSLVSFLGGEQQIKGKRFVDVGCGSGLFSLAALELGAAEVVSIDVDETSVACAQTLKARRGSPTHWKIYRGSALDQKFFEGLGEFDVVYSWGVLHHTGDMWSAIKNTTNLVAPSGKLYLAIYNDCTNLLHGSSRFWHSLKRYYNRAGSVMKRLLYIGYANYLFLGLIVTGHQPARYIRNYQSARGMSWRHDIIDWLGGYPYEYASPATMISALGQYGFGCTKLVYYPTIACNEYCFERLMN